jgi:hypothetical protein
MAMREVTDTDPTRSADESPDGGNQLHRQIVQT